jgi:origin recognition complex subunit 3
MNLHFSQINLTNMNHEKSYIFARERQAKRRCVESSGLDSSWHLRERTYRELWSEEQRRVNEVLENANRATLDDLIKFLKDAGDIENRKKSPCGMILAGPSIAAHASLFDQLSQRITAETSSSFVLLTSVDAPNLKTLLKAIIKGGISRRDADEEDVEMMSSVRRGPKLLSYDLQLLYEWVSEKHVEQVVVAFRDTEAFDSNVLSEALELLG